MELEERSGDSRSVEGSFRRRIPEPQVEENSDSKSYRFLRSPQNEPVTTYGRAGSVRDYYRGSCLNEDTDSHFRRLSLFSEKLQRMESTTKKFQWESLFAKTPVNANSKSSVGLKQGNGYENGNQGLEFPHLIPKPLFIDNLEANNLPKSHTPTGATKDSNSNYGDAARARSFEINGSYMFPSRKFSGTAHESNDVFIRNYPMFESARASYEEKRKETSSYETQTSNSHSNVRNNEFEGISQDKSRGFLQLPVFTGEKEEFTEPGAALINSPLCQQMATTMDPVGDGYESTVRGIAETRVRRHLVYEYSCTIGSPSAMNGKFLGIESGTQLKSKKEIYSDSEMFQLPEDGSNGLYVSENDQSSGEKEVKRKQRRGGAYSGLHHSIKATPKRKRSVNSRFSVQKPLRNRSVFSRINHFSYGYGHSAVEDFEVHLCRGNEQREDSKWPRRSSQYRNVPRSRNIKKRRGPPLRDLSTNPFVRELEKTKWLRNTNHDFQSGDCFEEKTKPSTRKLPGDTEELIHQTKSAFLKFVKILNENPARRKKHIEGGPGALKCIVCGSNSKEFIDTSSLSHHAYDSSQGSRAEHLGLHKALCFLMGWNSEAAPNSKKWVRRALPYSDLTALNEDLIIWPPVIIIHNVSIASERVTISCEELEGVIRGMGFGEKMKVVDGKPGNESIMVVNFAATFSGLQEAERLHRHCLDNNHGRYEFEKVNSSYFMNSQRDLDAKRMESGLYGYLGLAEDLDKLNFQTKKRSVVKSKKEIRAIVDA